MVPTPQDSGHGLEETPPAGEDDPPPNRLDHPGDFHSARHITDVSPPATQVDSRLNNSGKPLQGLFHPQYSQPADHPCHVEKGIPIPVGRRIIGGDPALRGNEQVLDHDMSNCFQGDIPLARISQTICQYLNS